MAKTIAIDGPAGSGKSTIGRLVAEALGYTFLDAGKLYRAISSTILAMNINPTEATKVVEALTLINIQVRHKENSVSPSLLVNGTEITSELHNEAINRNVAIVAAYPEARYIVRNIQKDFAKNGRIVYSGRDIGTVILPDADLKIFLSVSVEERARRRLNDISSPGVTLDQVINDLLQRDTKDTERAISPMRIPHDAHVLKTDGLEKEAVVSIIVDLVEAISISLREQHGSE